MRTLQSVIFVLKCTHSSQIQKGGILGQTLCSAICKEHTRMYKKCQIFWRIEVRTKRHRYLHPNTLGTQMLKAKGANPMPKDGVESVRLHRAILEMIALHNRPFTIVEDVGMLFVFSLMNAAFVCYGADHFSTVILQDCVKWATWTITQELLKQVWIHFTSDLWLCQLTGYHMLLFWL